MCPVPRASAPTGLESLPRPSSPVPTLADWQSISPSVSGRHTPKNKTVLIRAMPVLYRYNNISTTNTLDLRSPAQYSETWHGALPATALTLNTKQHHH